MDLIKDSNRKPITIIYTSLNKFLMRLSLLDLIIFILFYSYFFSEKIF